jgi:ribosome maturation factor RimP
MISRDEIAQLVEERLAGSEFFLVETKLSPAKIAVFIDHPKGVKLEDCVEISRYLQSKLDEELMTHELEVSSPGIDEPLRVSRQYTKNQGKEVAVLFKNGIKKEGRLEGSDEQGITMSGQQYSFAEIKECRTVFSFKGK